ncbi:MAG: hypothetical protein HOJ29_03975, partial [Candidatus Magasanikbacteria bacterium]|nr:hypothetical protein [Candidatus Magasanikbacteria bacterium]
FKALSEKESLSHAYAIVGPKHVGKHPLIKHIVAEILQCSIQKLHTHPDIVTVTQEVNKKTEKLKKHIDIEQIRTLRSYVHKRPYLGKYKVAIIDGAEKMNANAANGLLKTLEEPAAHTILFLLTHDVEALPQTIRSRVQSIYLHEVEETKIQQALEKRNIETDLSRIYAKMARGLPGLALSWAKDSEIFNGYKKEVDRCVSLIGKPLYKKMSIVDELFGDKTDHISTRGKLVEALSIWEMVLRDALFTHSGLHEHTVHKHTQVSIPIKDILNVTKRITEAKEGLRQNVHPKLLVEEILIAFP